jgi:hypothetical protein
MTPCTCLSVRVYADAGPSGQTYACVECDGLGWVPNEHGDEE